MENVLAPSCRPPSCPVGCPAWGGSSLSFAYGAPSGRKISHCGRHPRCGACNSQEPSPEPSLQAASVSRSITECAPGDDKRRPLCTPQSMETLTNERPLLSTMRLSKAATPGAGADVKREGKAKTHSLPSGTSMIGHSGLPLAFELPGLGEWCGSPRMVAPGPLPVPGGAPANLVSTTGPQQVPTGGRDSVPRWLPAGTAATPAGFSACNRRA
mmetsp:Transcript_57600/g.184977  ORF Transcript_57600/g.184977 Transcript_57600/m.184977 type:complete len:213 (-) Transcript_57600:511-1149(-)